MMAKICGITNAGDALAAAAGGAGALGFNFWRGSPRFITPERALPLLEQVPASVLKIGVFVDESAAAIREVATRLRLDAVQIHGGCEWPEGLRVWKALAVDDQFRLELLDQFPADAFLLDAPSGALRGGAGRTFDWVRARGARRRVVIAGGLDDTNVRLAIETARPWGVDACSRLDSAPGVKDPRKLAAFLKAALHETS